MAQRPREPKDGAAEDRVAPIPRSSLPDAIALLFEAYSTDPTLAELFGLTGGQVIRTLPTIRGVLAAVSSIPDSTLGCYRAGRLVGVVTFFPDLNEPIARLLLRRPVTMIEALLRQAWVKLRHRPRLPPESMARWRAYVSLGRAQAPRHLTLHVLALGVAEASRRSGVARQLLAAVESDTRWGPRVRAMQVETWHPSKVAIYKRLGFETIAHGMRDGVECWTMSRPLAA